MNLSNLSLSVLTGLTLSVFAPIPVLAATFTVAEVEFDSDLAVTNGVVIQDGSGGEGLVTFGNNFPAGNTVGSFFQAGNPDNVSVELGDDDLPGSQSHRDIIQLDWGGNAIGNSNDWDFAIYENGTPEPFTVSVRDAQTGEFSDFLFEPSEATYDEDAQVTVTLIDLSLFGIDFIDAIQIQNALPGDFDPEFAAQFGGPDSTTWDPDITYVVASNFAIPPGPSVPEPGLTLGLGLVGLGWFALKVYR